MLPKAERHGFADILLGPHRKPSSLYARRVVKGISDVGDIVSGFTALRSLVKPEKEMERPAKAF